MDADFSYPCLSASIRGLEHVPEELIVDFVVVLDFGLFNEGAEESWAAIGAGLFQVGVTALDVFAQEGGRPFGNLEVVDRVVDVVGEIARGGTQTLYFGDVAVQAGFE